MPEGGEIRRYRRFAGWDYTKGASLFITIATEPRRMIFGRVVNGKMSLSPLGEKAKEAIEIMPQLNPGLKIFGHVVMPDHIHFNCALMPGLHEPLKVLGNAVRRMKNYTTKLARLAELSSAITAGRGVEGMAIDAAGRGVEGAAIAAARRGAGSTAIAAAGRGEGGRYSNDDRIAFGKATIWQQGYHDYILVSREMIDSTERYIAYNPQKWELMYGVGGGLRIVEPLCSPRLSIGDYWKGVGNRALIGDDVKMVSLRVSREVTSPAAIAKVVRRLEAAVDKGYIVISGFISKGEKAVRDMLCRRRGARFVRMLPSCIPNKRFKPDSIYVEPFAEGRYLELGRGNDEVEFGRGACLDINAEIIEIATAGEGLSLYWKADGPHVLAKHSLANNVEAVGEAGGAAAREVTIDVAADQVAIDAGEGGAALDSIRCDAVCHATHPGIGFSVNSAGARTEGQTMFGQTRRGL